VGEHPRYASGYVVQGKCLYDAGRAKDAQAAFDRVLELDPKNLVALKFLGIISAERGDTRRAQEYFEHILVLAPDDREIRSRMEDVTQAGSKVAPRAAAAPVALVAEKATVSEAPAVATQPAPEPDADFDEAPMMLPDVEDEDFAGEPITLRDESVTSDEIATTTLADIYASQGYTSRALKIYREVHRRQPGNAALAAKIAKLEKTEAQSAPVRTVEKAPAAPVQATPEAAPRAVAESQPTPPSSAPGVNANSQSIDPSRSYEQFKRWLKATSR
jgi:tetratricopeptide (TPR) repeat protein